MWPFDDDSNQAPLAQPTADTTGMGGMYSPSALFDNKDFRRHAGYEALTNAGLALIAASAPSSTPQTAASAFGALAGGAAQGVNNSADRYLKNLQLGAQMQNMRMRQQMMQGVLNSPDPTAAPQAAPQDAGAPAPAAAAPSAGAVLPTADLVAARTAAGDSPQVAAGWAANLKHESGVPGGFNTAAVNPKDGSDGSDSIGIGQWNGPRAAALKKFAADNGTSVNDPKTQMAYLQAEVDGTVPYNVSGVSPDFKDRLAKAKTPDEAAALISNEFFKPRGGQGEAAHRGITAVQLAQAGPQPMPQGGEQPIGNQPGAMPAPQQSGLQLPSMPQPMPVPKQLNAMLLSGDPGMKAMAQSRIAQINTLNSNAMERWKANVALLQHNQTTTLEKQKMEQTERNAKVTQAGPNNELATAETNIESAKERGKEEERTRFVYGSSDWANKTPEELRKQANPEAITLVDAIQNGQALSNIATRAGGSGGMDINKNDLIALGTKMYGKSFDTNYGEQKKEFAVNMAPGKDGGKQLASISNAAQHLTDAAEAYNEMNNGKYPLGNRIFNAAKTASGWGPEKGYQAIMKPVATEMARVISGSSDNSVTEREALDEITAAWNSPEQMQSVFNKYAGLAQKRLNTNYAQAKVYGYDKEYIDKRLGEYGSEALSKIPGSIKQIAAPQGAPAAVSAIPLVASPDEAVKLGSGKTFRIMKDGKEMIGTVP